MNRTNNRRTPQPLAPAAAAQLIAAMVNQNTTSAKFPYTAELNTRPDGTITATFTPE